MIAAVSLSLTLARTYNNYFEVQLLNQESVWLQPTKQICAQYASIDTRRVQYIVQCKRNVLTYKKSYITTFETRTFVETMAIGYITGKSVSLTE